MNVKKGNISQHGKNFHSKSRKVKQMLCLCVIPNPKWHRAGLLTRPLQTEVLASVKNV